MNSAAEQCDTQATCPNPACEEGQQTIREETATGYSVYRTTCPICDGAGTLPVWQAMEYRARRTQSGVMPKVPRN